MIILFFLIAVCAVAVAWCADTTQENKRLWRDIESYKHKINMLHDLNILEEEELARIYENTGRNEDE